MWINSLSCQVDIEWMTSNGFNQTVVSKFIVSKATLHTIRTTWLNHWAYAKCEWNDKDLLAISAWNSAPELFQIFSKTSFMCMKWKAVYIRICRKIPTARKSGEQEHYKSNPIQAKNISWVDSHRTISHFI